MHLSRTPRVNLLRLVRPRVRQPRSDPFSTTANGVGRLRRMHAGACAASRDQSAQPYGLTQLLQGNRKPAVARTVCAVVRMIGSRTLGGGCERSKLKMSTGDA